MNALSMRNKGEYSVSLMTTIPQRLKPRSFCEVCGTSKLVPFQNGEFFSKL